jgi:hypothetical protein
MSKKKETPKAENAPKHYPKDDKEDNQVIPDPAKNIENLKFNSTYVSGLQGVLMYLLSTSEDADQITKAYAKINKLETQTEEKPYEGEPFTGFEESLWTLLQIISYLRYEMINQKAYFLHDADLTGETIKESMQKLFLGDPKDFDANAKEIQDKIAAEINKSQPI